MFFDKYKELCSSHGKSPNGVAKELGFPSSSVTQWKRGSVPRPAALQIIAGYFGVTVEYLISGEGNKKAAPEAGDGALDTSGLSADAIELAKLISSYPKETQASFMQLFQLLSRLPTDMQQAYPALLAAALKAQGLIE